MGDLVRSQPVGAAEGRDAGPTVNGHVTPGGIRVARHFLVEHGSISLRRTWVDEDPDGRPIGFGWDQEAIFGLEPGDGEAIRATTPRAILERLWTVNHVEIRLPGTPTQDRTMSEDRGDAQEQGDVQDAREDYVAPALTDLGSFEELTQFNPGSTGDTEGTS
jgi:hypothetical protein